MKKQILFILICLPFLLAAQSYDTAAGIRLGTDGGFTVKQRVAKLTTVEGILQSSFQRKEVILTVLGERHFPIITRRLNIYMGGGLHKGWINEINEEEPTSEYKNPFGVSGIAGAELSLGRFNLSYDFKPAVNISGGQHTVYSQTGISLRYVIVKRNWLNKNKKKKQRQKRKRQREREKNKKDGKGGFNWKIWEKN